MLVINQDLNLQCKVSHDMSANEDTLSLFPNTSSIFKVVHQANKLYIRSIKSTIIFSFLAGLLSFMLLWLFPLPPMTIPRVDISFANIVVMIILTLSSLFFSICVLVVLDHYLKKQSLSMKEIFLKARQRYFPVMLSSLLLYGLAMVLAGIIFIISLYGYSTLVPLKHGIALIYSAVIFVLLCWLLVLFLRAMLNQIAVLIDNKSPLDGIEYSYHLTHGRNNIFGTLAIMFIIAVVALLTQFIIKIVI